LHEARTDNAMQLFTPTADAVMRAALAILLSAPVLLVVGLMLIARSPLGNGSFASIEQPVQFDHRHHVSDDGIDCRYCHDTVGKSATAGIPPTSRCMGCHAQVWNQSPKLQLVRESYYEDRPLEWNRVNRVPDFVFFNHSVHINKGVGCISCHGRIDQMPVVEQVSSLSMGWCLDCHRNPEPHLRPVDAVTAMDWKPSDSSGLTPPRAHPRTECTTCHR
jgi:hypothetical protein